MQEYRKVKFRTIKDFATALGCSSSKASGICQGRYLNSSPDEIRKIADVLGITFQQCLEAMQTSYDQLMAPYVEREQARRDAEQEEMRISQSLFQRIPLKNVKSLR